MRTQKCLIQNKQQIYNKKTQDALDVLDAGLQAALPENSLADVITKNKLRVGNKSYSLSKYGKIYVVAVGKAADSMAKLVFSKIKIDEGIVVIPQNYVPQFCHNKFKIYRAGHPIPNKSSVAAAKAILALLQNTGKNDLVIFLVSGGASALVCMPEGLTLGQKQKMTRLLLKCGASIDEINSIRKHISSIKGGKLVQNLQCSAISLVMSDVVGDNLADIASGLTYFDDSTFSDCVGIIRKYSLEQNIPPSIVKRFKLGVAGGVTETPKSPTIPNFVVATNKDCVDAMAKKATSLGYRTKTLQISGNVKTAAKKILQGFSNGKKSCLVFGGETTVQVTGSGRGGRNQELVMRILQNLQNEPAIVVASIGTDGIDGNTKHAGAIFDFIPNKNEIKDYLKENNSNAFFKKHKRLILTGPTHTNLMDVGLILRS